MQNASGNWINGDGNSVGHWEQIIYLFDSKVQSIIVKCLYLDKWDKWDNETINSLIIENKAIWEQL